MAVVKSQNTSAETATSEGSASAIGRQAVLDKTSPRRTSLRDLLQTLKGRPSKYQSPSSPKAISNSSKKMKRSIFKSKYADPVAPPSVAASVATPAVNPVANVAASDRVAEELQKKEAELKVALTMLEEMEAQMNGRLKAESEAMAQKNTIKELERQMAQDKKHSEGLAAEKRQLEKMIAIMERDYRRLRLGMLDVNQGPASSTGTAASPSGNMESIREESEEAWKIEKEQMEAELELLRRRLAETTILYNEEHETARHLADEIVALQKEQERLQQEVSNTNEDIRGAVKITKTKSGSLANLRRSEYSVATENPTRRSNSALSPRSMTSSLVFSDAFHDANVSAGAGDLLSTGLPTRRERDAASAVSASLNSLVRNLEQERTKELADLEGSREERDRLEGRYRELVGTMNEAVRIIERLKSDKSGMMETIWRLQADRAARSERTSAMNLTISGRTSAVSMADSSASLNVDRGVNAQRKETGVAWAWL